MLMGERREPEFKVGDAVERSGGSYTFPGTVIAVGVTSLGRRLYMVEHATERGMVHVFRSADLKHSERRD